MRKTLYESAALTLNNMMKADRFLGERGPALLVNYRGPKRLDLSLRLGDAKAVAYIYGQIGRTLRVRIDDPKFTFDVDMLVTSVLEARGALTEATLQSVRFRTKAEGKP